MTTIDAIAIHTSRTVILLLAVAALAACGGSGTTTLDTGSIAGRYVVDVDRTMAAKPGGGAPLAQDLRDQFRPERYALELRADGSFTLEAGSGEGALRVDGTWGQGAGGGWLSTAAVDGEPTDVGPDPVDAFTAEPGRIVLDGGGQPIHLVKQG
jgi:hypothetical protein